MEKFSVDAYVGVSVSVSQTPGEQNEPPVIQSEPHSLSRSMAYEGLDRQQRFRADALHLLFTDLSSDELEKKLLDNHPNPLVEIAWAIPFLKNLGPDWYDRRVVYAAARRVSLEARESRNHTGTN